MMLWGCQPDDGLGFERYLESQEIPVIRIPMKPAGKPNVTIRGTDKGLQAAASEVNRRLEEWVPEPEPNPAWDCEEDDATRLARMLQCEEMRTGHLWRELDQMTRKRDFWRRWCGIAYGVALAALIVLAAVWR